MKKRLLNRKRLMQIALSLCLILVSANTSLGQTIINGPVTSTYTVPAGIYSITLEVWGGGGAGGSVKSVSPGTNAKGGGGAGGGFASKTIAVTPGDVISYTVGGGGVSSVSTANNVHLPAADGGNTTVTYDSNVILLAQGGPGGNNAYNSTDTTARLGFGGVAPTNGNTGTILFYGGNGGLDLSLTAAGTAGGGGGSAGRSGNGGAGALTTAGAAGANGGAAGGLGQTNSAVSTAGTAPGAGGGGARTVTANITTNGSSGAAGRLVIILNSNSVISATGTTMAAFLASTETASASQSFSVSGTELTANLVVSTTSTDFELSTDPDFINPAGGATINLTGANVPATTIYVRLKAGLVFGSKTGTVSITSVGASTVPDVSLSGTVRTVFYYDGLGGSLSDVTNWGVNADGTGTEPNVLTGSDTSFVIANGPATTDAAWILGANSKLIVGNGATVTLTVADTFPITGTIDVTATGIVVWQDTTPPVVGPPAINYSPTFGTLANASEVHLQPATAVEYALGITSYGKLFIDGAEKVSISSTSTATVKTALTVASGSTLDFPVTNNHYFKINAGASVTINGTVRAGRQGGLWGFNNASTSSTAGVSISFVDATPNLTLGASSTIEYYRPNATQTVSLLPSGVKYANLTLSENAATSNNVKYIPGAITVNGTLTVNLASISTTTLFANNITLANGATIVMTSGALDVAPVFAGTVNVTYNGTGATQIFGNTVIDSPDVLLSLPYAAIAPGMTVTGTNVPAGTTVASISGTALVLSQNATATTAVNTYVSLTFGTAVPQTTGFEIPSNASQLNNLTIDNPVGVILNSSTTVNNDLTLAVDSALTIPTGNNLTVDNAIVNDGTITVENTANLVQTALTNTNSGSGTAIVKRNSNPLKRLDYTMWSSPVSGAQTLADFSPKTSQSPNRFYAYDPTSNLYVNVPPTSTFATGTGYLIRMPNEDPTPDYNTGGATLAYPGQFTGTLNNGDVSVTTNSGSYYSVGNPYPSTIDAQEFLDANTTDGTLYFWRKTNGTANTFVEGSSTGTAYATWTTLGGVASSTDAPNDILPNGTIQVGQGFIVKSNATSLTFTNAMRNGTVSTQFFKTKQVAEKSRVWLNLTNTTGVFSQALVGYVDGATLGVDNGIDGKYINDSAIALTSNINGEEYTIQGRAAFDASDVVALNFKTDVAGDYTIAIDHTDGLFASGQEVYLLDSKTGTETDLKSGSYTFNATAGVDNARFSLKYQKTLKVDASSFNENSVRVYKNNGTLYVNSGNVAISNIKVYDIQGRLIAEQKNVKATTATINNLKASNQVLIVKISGKDNSVVTKKVVN